MYVCSMYCTELSMLIQHKEHENKDCSKQQGWAIQVSGLVLDKTLEVRNTRNPILCPFDQNEKKGRMWPVCIMHQPPYVIIENVYTGEVHLRSP